MLPSIHKKQHGAKQQFAASSSSRRTMSRSASVEPSKSSSAFLSPKRLHRSLATVSSTPPPPEATLFNTDQPTKQLIRASTKMTTVKAVRKDAFATGVVTLKRVLEGRRFLEKEDVSFLKRVYEFATSGDHFLDLSDGILALASPEDLAIGISVLSTHATLRKVDVSNACTDAQGQAILRLLSENREITELHCAKTSLSRATLEALADQVISNAERMKGVARQREKKRKLQARLDEEATNVQLSASLVAREVNKRKVLDAEEDAARRRLMALEHMAHVKCNQSVKFRQMRTNQERQRLNFAQQEEEARIVVIFLEAKKSLSVFAQSENVHRMWVAEQESVAYENLEWDMRESWTNVRLIEEKRKRDRKLERLDMGRVETDARRLVVAEELQFRNALIRMADDLSHFAERMMNHRMEREATEQRRRKNERDRLEKERMLQRDRDRAEELRRNNERKAERDKLEVRSTQICFQLDKDEHENFLVLKSLFDIMMPLSKIRGQLADAEVKLAAHCRGMHLKCGIEGLVSAYTFIDTVPRQQDYRLKFSAAIPGDTQMEMDAMVAKARDKRRSAVTALLLARRKIIVDGSEMALAVAEDFGIDLADLPAEHFPRTHDFCFEKTVIRNCRIRVTILDINDERRKEQERLAKEAKRARKRLNRRGTRRPNASLSNSLTSARSGQGSNPFGLNSSRATSPQAVHDVSSTENVSALFLSTSEGSPLLAGSGGGLERVGSSDSQRMTMSPGTQSLQDDFEMILTAPEDIAEVLHFNLNEKPSLSNWQVAKVSEDHRELELYCETFTDPRNVEAVMNTINEALNSVSHSAIAEDPGANNLTKMFNTAVKFDLSVTTAAVDRKKLDKRGRFASDDFLSSTEVSSAGFIQHLTVLQPLVRKPEDTPQLPYDQSMLSRPVFREVEAEVPARLQDLSHRCEIGGLMPDRPLSFCNEDMLFKEYTVTATIVDPRPGDTLGLEANAGPLQLQQGKLMLHDTKIALRPPIVSIFTPTQRVSDRIASCPPTTTSLSVTLTEGGPIEDLRGLIQAMHFGVEIGREVTTGVRIIELLITDENGVACRCFSEVRVTDMISAHGVALINPLRDRVHSTVCGAANNNLATLHLTASESSIQLFRGATLHSQRRQDLRRRRYTPWFEVSIPAPIEGGAITLDWQRVGGLAKHKNGSLLYYGEVDALTIDETDPSRLRVEFNRTVTVEVLTEFIEGIVFASKLTCLPPQVTNVSLTLDLFHGDVPDETEESTAFPSDTSPTKQFEGSQHSTSTTDTEGPQRKRELSLTADSSDAPDAFSLTVVNEREETPNTSTTSIHRMPEPPNLSANDNNNQRSSGNSTPAELTPRAKSGAGRQLLFGQSTLRITKPIFEVDASLQRRGIVEGCGTQSFGPFLVNDHPCAIDNFNGGYIDVALVQGEGPEDLMVLRHGDNNPIRIELTEVQKLDPVIARRLSSSSETHPSVPQRRLSQSMQFSLSIAAFSADDPNVLGMSMANFSPSLLSPMATGALVGKSTGLSALAVGPKRKAPAKLSKLSETNLEQALRPGEDKVMSVLSNRRGARHGIEDVMGFTGTTERPFAQYVAPRGEESVTVRCKNAIRDHIRLRTNEFFAMDKELRRSALQGNVLRTYDLFRRDEANPQCIGTVKMTRTAIHVEFVQPKLGEKPISRADALSVMEAIGYVCEPCPELTNDKKFLKMRARGWDGPECQTVLVAAVDKTENFPLLKVLFPHQICEIGQYLYTALNAHPLSPYGQCEVADLSTEGGFFDGGELKAEIMNPQAGDSLVILGKEEHMKMKHLFDVWRQEQLFLMKSNEPVDARVVEILSRFPGYEGGAEMNAMKSLIRSAPAGKVRNKSAEDEATLGHVFNDQKQEIVRIVFKEFPGTEKKIDAASVCLAMNCIGLRVDPKNPVYGPRVVDIHLKKSFDAPRSRVRLIVDVRPPKMIVGAKKADTCKRTSAGPEIPCFVMDRLQIRLPGCIRNGFLEVRIVAPAEADRDAVSMLDHETLSFNSNSVTQNGPELEIGGAYLGRTVICNPYHIKIDFDWASAATQENILELLQSLAYMHYSSPRENVQRQVEVVLSYGSQPNNPTIVTSTVTIKGVVDSEEEDPAFLVSPASPAK